MKLRIRLLDPEELDRFPPDTVLIVAHPGAKYPAMTMRPALLEVLNDNLADAYWEPVEFVQ